MLQCLPQNPFRSRTLNGVLALSAGFFLLYALTAQRGWGWGDSAEFHDWVLNQDAFICGPHFSNAHPLYVCFCRLVAGSPFVVTLVSSFFGAVSVGGLFLCTRRFGLSVVFGLSHMLWWNSCLAEVQTMNLAFLAFETVLLLRFLERDDWRLFAALVFLNGVHLNAHNLALLELPVYAAADLRLPCRLRCFGCAGRAAGSGRHGRGDLRTCWSVRMAEGSSGLCLRIGR